jgi:hypothetical protein
MEAAQVMLGQARADVTKLYAERDQQLAATVAARIRSGQAGHRDTTARGALPGPLLWG